MKLSTELPNSIGLREQDNRSQEQWDRFQDDRVTALRNERANLLREIARKDATIRVLRSVVAQQIAELEQYRTEKLEPIQGRE